MFQVKDPIPRVLRAGVVYQFLCAGCNAFYVKETTRHFSTRIREHMFIDGPLTFFNTYKILSNAMPHLVL